MTKGAFGGHNYCVGNPIGHYCPRQGIMPVLDVVLITWQASESLEFPSGVFQMISICLGLWNGDVVPPVKSCSKQDGVPF